MLDEIVIIETVKTLLIEETEEVLEMVDVGIQGPPGISPTYEHVQAVASTTWTINHNLGFKPAVQLFTAGGVEFEAQVLHNGLNQVIVYTNAPVAGSARLT